ncbi:MAG: cell division protein FtsQ/DivIB [Eubacteriales bacterium]
MSLLQEKKVKKRRIYRKNYVTLVIIMFLLIIITFYFLLFTDFFNIENISVSGNSRVTNEEIFIKSGLKTGENIFMFNKKSVIEPIEKIPYIKNARLLRLFPNKIMVSIEERIPLGIFYYNNKFIYVDSQEIIVDYTDELYNTDIPLITAVSETIGPIEIGKPITVDPQWIKKNIFEIINEFDQNSLLIHISEINITKDNLLYIYTKGGSILKVKNSDVVHEKIDFIRTYLEEKDERMIIDLIHGGNPTYIPR